MKSIIFILVSVISLSLFAQIEDYGIEQATGFTTPQRGIKNISIVDEDIVWALAYDGSGNNDNVQEFTKTINQGELWTPGVIDVGNPDMGIAMIHAVSENIAWVVAYPLSTGQIGGVFKTIDGGLTWFRQNTALFNMTGSYPNVVYFWDENNGFCQGDPVDGYYELYTTTDGGDNWIRVPSANIPAPQSGDYGLTGKIYVTGNAIWWMTHHDLIFRSYDLGNSFEVFQAPLCDFGGGLCDYHLSFSDDNNGYLINLDGAYWRSSDGGETWVLTFPDSGFVFGDDIFAIPNTDIVITTGINGLTGISISFDAGTNWTVIDDTIPLTDIKFLNPNLGWVGSFNTSSTEGGIYKIDATLSVNSEDFNQSISCIPNPFTNEFKVSSNQVIIDIKVFSMLGQVLYNDKPNSLSCTINALSFPNATYLVQVTNGDTIRTIKMMK